MYSENQGFRARDRELRIRHRHRQPLEAPQLLQRARAQPPEQSEAGSMPGKNGLWLDNDQDFGP